MTEQNKGIVRRVVGGLLSGLTFVAVLVMFELGYWTPSGFSFDSLFWVYIAFLVLALHAMITDARSGFPFNIAAIMIVMIMYCSAIAIIGSTGVKNVGPPFESGFMLFLVMPVALMADTVLAYRRDKSQKETTKK